MADLTDELLKIIVEGSGRAYSHEAKAMAKEIIRRRAEAKDAVLSATQPIVWNPGFPP
jgi:hypothetical protein